MKTAQHHITALVLLINTFSFSQNVQLKGKNRVVPPEYEMGKMGVVEVRDAEKGLFKKDRVIYKLEHGGNKLTAHYYDISSPETAKKDSIFIPYKSFVAISEWKRGLDVSVLNIPFKIRPKLDTIPGTATADIKNIGLFLGNSFTSDRYFYNGKSSRHKFTVGGFLSPTLITLNQTNTNGAVDGDLSQMGLSIGAGINYTYRSISFVLIPMGFDIGLSSQSKDWIYNKKYWFGFGIGIDTTLLSF